MPKMKKIVLFDFDGVIVDTFDICYAINVKTHKQLTKSEFRDFFKGNIYETEEKLVEQGDLPNEEEFFAEYTPRVFETPPVEGMPAVIEKLGELYQMAVISSTITSPIQGYVEKYNLAQHFDWIMGGDVHRSKTAKIQMALNEYKAKAENCVFITDTLGDMREAAKCNVQSIGVTWGYQPREYLTEGNFYRLVDSMNEIIPAVQGFFNKHL